MEILYNSGTLLIILGLPFFLSGTVGLIRFPDIYTRLHALTKADNVGLGCIVCGLALQSASWAVTAKLLLIWLLVLIASSASCHLIARSAMQKNIQPWTRP
ncbi:MAG: monovalent cation/H(+) antiporter subunit G [Proteobacteria bacterium]|nr:monovalent cation/H(+) antiporter subunit G [Pseudomonadota bacterium]MBU1234082.1 monovalent cation/H(+) antiporter subunit G [Pseudomonadota bacterium]MBU1418096.1 monovalent cation/H(+) antiporter subunit G [Pseudomonadota bacterium]MBU1456473.1 monovalent cation/H(+) antiporter subunit G [Pseudomonadota bacterium]